MPRARRSTISVAVALLAAATLANCSAPESGEAVPTTPASTFPTPIEGAEPTYYTVEMVELSASLAPGDVPGAWVALLDTWDMAGATQEAADRKLCGDDEVAGLTWSEYARQIAEENGAVFAKALLGPGWATDGNNDEGEAVYVNARIDLNFANISNWFVESDFVYSHTLTAQGPVTNDNGLVAAEIEIVETNNADENRVGEVSPSYLQLDGRWQRALVTFKLVGDSYLQETYSVLDD